MIEFFEQKKKRMLVVSNEQLLRAGCTRSVALTPIIDDQALAAEPLSEFPRCRQGERRLRIPGNGTRDKRCVLIQRRKRRTLYKKGIALESTKANSGVAARW
ncbi:MAG: hypothetical protein M1831_002661 [Alyxoria varia]|nr:MAG: hypothetical protein M1831_002661 [Alyxoria varia]